MQAFGLRVSRLQCLGLFRVQTLGLESSRVSGWDFRVNSWEVPKIGDPNVVP